MRVANEINYLTNEKDESATASSITLIDYMYY